MTTLEQRFIQRKHWYESRAGRVQLEAEARFVSQHLGRITGFQGLLAAPCADFAGLVEIGRFRFMARLQHCAPLKLEGDFHAWVDCLPVCSELLDVVVLVHVLDWQEEPLVVLQEWIRLLKPGGRLLLTMNRSAIGPWYPWPGPATPSGYLPWLTRRRLQAMGLEAISRQWLLPQGTARNGTWPWLAPMRAPVVGLHLRKTRRQALIQPLTQPGGAALPLTRA